VAPPLVTLSAPVQKTLTSSSTDRRFFDFAINSTKSGGASNTIQLAAIN
jgi:hypothetical protein